MSDIKNPNSINAQPEDRLVTTGQLQVEIDTTAATADLSYTRLDGTIERAANSQEAIARCPYLGKLPLEQANVLLELSRAGKALLSNETTQASDLPAKPKTEASVNSKTAVDETSDPKPITSTIETVPVIKPPETPRSVVEANSLQLQSAINLATKYLDRQHLPRQKNSDETLTELPTRLETTLDNLAPPSVVFVEKPSAPLITPTEALALTATKLEYENRAIADKPNSVSKLKQPIDKITTNDEVVTRSDDPDNFAAAEFSLETPDTTEPHPAITDEDMASFQQLLELIDLDKPESLAVSDPDTTAPSELVISRPLEDNTFEDYMAAQPVSETVSDLEALQLVANEQPLENSLAQLTKLIRETPTEHQTIIMTIRELATAFELEVSDDQPEAAGLTPDITRQLLSLLRLIGYAHPEQSLLDMVARHDLDFLVSAIRYLAQLTNPNDRQEFMGLNLFSPLVKSIIHPLAERIGKTVMKLAYANFGFGRPHFL